MKVCYFFICLCIFINLVSGQIGGQSVYSFLNTSSSAQVTALAGAVIASPENDIALAIENPAQLTGELDGQLSFQHLFIQQGIQAGYAGFGKSLGVKGMMMHGGIKYIGYGTFEETDEFGNTIGEFKGNELAIQTGASYQLYEKMRFGANIKFIQSSLDIYRSSGLALDLGALYIDTASGFTAALVIKQLGTQLSTYETIRETLPLNVMVGFSKRLKHLPFRFSMTWHHLNKWNLLYNDPRTEEGGGFGGLIPVVDKPTQTDNFFRHIIFGGEMMLGKKELFKIRIGYNHQHKQELSVTNLRSLTGFSFGIGLRVKKFQFDYGTSRLHFGGSSHHLGLSTNLRYFSGSGIL